MQVKEIRLLEFDEFKKIWIKKAGIQGKKKNIKINAEFWLLNVQNFLEYFFLEHLNISMDDCIEFGYVDDLEKSGSFINSKDLSTSLIFCSANSVLSLSSGLNVDAYNYALKAYQSGSKEKQEVVQEIVRKYENNFLNYGQKIINMIDDSTLTSRMESIRKNFEFREVDYKSIKRHLTREFDTSLVFSFDQLYNTYSIAYYQVKVEEGGQ